jgi:hypothetical protein
VGPSLLTERQVNELTAACQPELFSSCFEVNNLARDTQTGAFQDGGEQSRCHLLAFKKAGLGSFIRRCACEAGRLGRESTGEEPGVAVELEEPFTALPCEKLSSCVLIILFLPAVGEGLNYSAPSLAE